MDNIVIRKATVEDLEDIHRIEVSFEGELAASVETLQKRMDLFPDGFVIAADDEGIIGYIQAIIWDGIENLHIESFTETDFENQHNEDAQLMYIIFIAVDKRAQNRSIGTKLMENMILLAKSRNIDIELISMQYLTDTFYYNLGFEVVKEMKDWLPDHKNFLMRLYLSHNPSI